MDMSFGKKEFAARSNFVGAACACQRDRPDTIIDN